MVKIELTQEMLDRNISTAETFIRMVETRKTEEHSGVAQLLLDSLIIDTEELLAELRKFAPAQETVPHFAPEYQPEG